MHTFKTLLTLSTTFMLLGSSTLLASEKSIHDKSALEIVNKAFQHTSSLQSYAFNAKISEQEAQEDGSSVTYTYTSAIKVKRPGQLRVDSKGQYLDRTMTLNNGLYSVLRHNDNTYSQLTVPKDIDQAIEAILHKYKLPKAPLASLVYSDVSQHVKLHKGLYIASETLEGVHCDHVRFTKPNRKVDIWVTQGKTPHIIAYHIKDTSKQPFVNTTAKIIWDEKVNMRSKDFVFKAPKESKKVEIITEDSEG